MNTGRYRDFEVGDVPPAAVAVLGVCVLALVCGILWYLSRLDHTGLRDAGARARAERREESRRRQDALRTRREALQRRAERRRGNGRP
ncbi:hypothetical protein [Streptomyces prasinosporus]